MRTQKLGSAAIGGKYMELSAAGINSDGTVVDKKALAHEAGHSGGLVHPWDFTKYKSGGKYMLNNRLLDMNTQKFNYSTGLNVLDNLTRNFMGYTSRST